MESKSLSTFRTSIRAAVRGIFSGSIDALSGADAIFSAIRRGFTQAWYEGAKQAGILPDELTPDELKKLGEMIGDNNQYVGRFVDWINQIKANGGTVQSVFDRAEMWINRYEEVKATAQSMAAGDKKLRWILGNTERHCRSCLKLNGRVHRASLWASKNIHPRMTDGRLACNGYRCDCRFMETDEPATKGRFPNLP